uniref:phosphopantetheine-binding protein n=1 Tax=Corynebacterium casei TaxID=160386 RepID=UPI00135A75DD
MKISRIVETLLEDSLNKKPNVENTFLEEGGDSFSALLLSEQLSKETSVEVTPEDLLSDKSLRSILER